MGSKNTQISNFMEIRPVGTESFHADRRTDRLPKLIVAFRNFAKAPKNELQDSHLTVLDTPNVGERNPQWSGTGVDVRTSAV